KAYCAIRVHREHRFTVGRILGVSDCQCISNYNTKLLACAHVPQAGGFIVAASQQSLAVRREECPIEAVLVALEDAQLLAGLRVPEADGFIPTSCGYILAVGRERYAPYGAAVSR